jgi:hypothetical protein
MYVIKFFPETAFVIMFSGKVKVHNEELHTLHASPSIVRVTKSSGIRWAERVVRMGEMNAYSILVGRPEGKIRLKGARHRRVDNIKMDLREMCLEAWTVCIWLRTGTNGGLL